MGRKQEKKRYYFNKEFFKWLWIISLSAFLANYIQAYNLYYSLGGAFGGATLYIIVYMIVKFASRKKK